MLKAVNEPLQTCNDQDKSTFFCDKWPAACGDVRGPPLHLPVAGRSTHIGKKLLLYQSKNSFLIPGFNSQ